VPHAAKLVGIDLKGNRIQKIIRFDASIAPEGAYLNDVRFDPNGKLAYLSDSRLGRIVVVELKSGRCRTVLGDHPSTKAEQGVTPIVEGVTLKAPDGGPFRVHVDGIAVAGDYLYYNALSARHTYRIPLEVLREKGLSAKKVAEAVEDIGETGMHDGLAGDPEGNVFLTQVEVNGLKQLKPDGTQEMLLTDARLQWPDSVNIGPDGLYVTVSQLHLLPWFHGGQSMRKNPYRVFRVVPEGWASPDEPAEPTRERPIRKSPPKEEPREKAEKAPEPPKPPAAAP
jgi:sugar lactone lactonase YvrE